MAANGQATTGATDGLSTAEWKQVFSLLDRALELTPEALPDWFASFDASQSHCVEPLRRLLADRPVIERTAFLTQPAQLELRRDPADTGDDSGEERVGPYRLLERIGSGGTATVWLAERADGSLNRRVALKRPDGPRLGRGQAEGMARERDILASLTHPNIARLYDAGVEADGRPYLAMEYIAGQPIDAYARDHGLTVRQRVALCAEVARAVSYAHSQLVVHRDLKPSNILVDAQGRVHLVDFGIAKLVDTGAAQAPSQSQHTMIFGRALTLDYASPEQVRGDPIGTASDIYSLGVVAFELLTGARPYRLDPTLGTIALAESVARSIVPAASRVAADHQVSQQLHGDLDAALARMLEKAGDERYPTMDAVADDLERFLANEPLDARRSSRWYVARRWLRRHRIETAIGVAVVLALVGGAYAQVAVGLALGLGAAAALWQRNEAIQQAERATRALHRVEQVKNFIASIFTQAVPSAGRDGGVAATDLLKVAARRLETDLVGQPAVAAELAALIGASFNQLGDPRAGLDWLPKAVDLCERELGPRHLLTLQSRRRLVEAANTVGDLATSATVLPALLRDLRVTSPLQAQLLAQTLESQAFILTKSEREAESFAALDEAVAVASEHLGCDHATTLTLRSSLSNTYIHWGRPREALAAIEPALAPAYAALGHQRPHPVLTLVERDYADALAQNQRPRDATLILRQTLADQIALEGQDTIRVSYALLMLGRALLFRGCSHEALGLLTRAAGMRDSLSPTCNDETVGTVAWLALAQMDAGRPQEALDRLARLDAARRSSGILQQASPCVTQALASLTLGRGAEALAILQEEHVLVEQASPTVHARAGRVRVMAERLTGVPEVALRMATDLLAHLDPQVLAIEHGSLLAEAARACAILGDFASAAACWQQAFDVWDRGQVDGREFREPLRDESALVARPTAAAAAKTSGAAQAP